MGRVIAVLTVACALAACRNASDRVHASKSARPHQLVCDEYSV